MTEEKKEYYDRLKAADLHLHSKDQYDSDNDANRVCKREKELGASAVAITQHGVASQVESFKKAAKKYGLKLIPGIETYCRMDIRGIMTVVHMILLAMDDTGWKALCMAISDSQDKAGHAVMDEGLLYRYFGEGGPGHGHVIATSACIAGPVAAVFRSNERVQKEIDKVKKKREKTFSKADSQALDEKKKMLAACTRAVENDRALYESLKKKPIQKFDRREKELGRLIAYGHPAALKEKQKLEEDKAKAAAQAQEITALKEKIKNGKKEETKYKKEIKEMEEAAAEDAKYADMEAELTRQLASERELFSLALKKMRRMERLFGKGNFYVEVQNHGVPLEAYIYPRAAALARRYGFPMVATNDVHTVDNSEEELLRRRMLRSLRFGKWSEDGPGDDQLYIKSGSQMAEWLLRILPESAVDEAMSNIGKIVERCNVRFEIAEHYPKFVSDDGRPSGEVFDSLVKEGIKDRFQHGLPAGYSERIERETEVMRKMGYVDYHLVVRDFNQYAAKYDSIPFERIKDAPINADDLDKWKAENGFTENVGMSNGTGRGSAVGSLVCDCLKITNLDPVKYGLYFERFLNPERVSMPDIDSDISRTVRPRVIEYVKRKYGKDCVCGIMTQNAQAPKGAVRIAAKCYGLYVNRENKKDDGAKKFLSLADQIAKKIPQEPGTAFDSPAGNATLYKWLLSEYAGNKDACEIIRWAKVFEGCFTAYGAHAAGIVITDGTPVKEIVPLRWNDKLGIYTTQCDMVEVEENGMLKFDFLGLKTVDIINDCLWQLHSEGINVNVYDIPLDDADVYKEIFSKGRTDSVFQFESTGMKEMLKRFRPETFEDLIILVSMFRPGPLQYLDGVIDIKNGRKKISFLTPELEPILGSTYGAITYQEQVMQIFQQLAGYTLGGADLVRRAMSKKKLAVLEKERKAFVYGDPDRKDKDGRPSPIKGCVANGISEKAANELFDQMTEFAKYAFNKSHAAAYAYNSYITGYLKYHYPAEFLMSAMRWAEKTQRKDPIPGLMAEARAMGVKVCAPDINRSWKTFTVENGQILFGLSAVRNVGAGADEIIEERNKNGKFRSFAEFFIRCSTKKDAVENLIGAGAFDSFGGSRKAMREAVEIYKKAAAKIKQKDIFLETSRMMLPFVDSLGTDEDVLRKQEELSLHMELKKAVTSEKLSKRINTAQKAADELREEYRSITIPDTGAEDMDQRMAEERELIGAYVTAHPLDSYPDISRIRGAVKIIDAGLKTRRIYGVISQIDMKRRKKDGKEMAFLDVEDRTGTIRVNVYTATYEKNREAIAQGNVVIIDGYAEERDVYGASENDDEVEKELVFTADSIVRAKKDS